MRCHRCGRRLACAAAVLAAAALPGCGEASPDEPDRTPPAATSPRPAIVITAPSDGMRLRARDSEDGALRLRTPVRGRARSGSVIRLRASCRPRPCHASATAGADGRWTVPMTLTTTRAARFVSIDASDAKRSSTPAAVTTVEFTGRRTTQVAGENPAAGTRRRLAAAPAARAKPASPRPRPRDVLVIGDSLALGMADSLRAALPGWRVRVDARIGRPLAEGMQVLGAQRDAPTIIALSLFTNDPPGATGQLAAAVRATAARPGGCAVWATIARPPLDGVSYAAANQVLERLARDPELEPALKLVDWKSLVGRFPSSIAGDGVHGTPQGYRARGRLYADAIRACAENT